jgi:hypothetical protein
MLVYEQGGRLTPAAPNTQRRVLGSYESGHREPWVEGPAARLAAEILRDVTGYPFRTVPFAAEWRTPSVLGLARAFYDAGELDALPILADALQEEGCENPEILDHCRGDSPHVRGCWVVDLVLGLN